jgi:hypothetical protein
MTTLTDPRTVLLRHLERVGSVRIDWRGRKRLARVLHLDADYKLELAVFALHRSGAITIEDDVLYLANARRLAAVA